MATLYHSALCPHSRFVRLIMGELAMEADLVEEDVAQRRREFLMMNAAGTLPVLVEHDGQVVVGPEIISEYLDETRGLVLDDRRLLPEDPSGRAEVRRLVAWFHQKFFAEVAEALIGEKIAKRQAGGSPDPGTLRAARTNVRYHFKYLEHLLARRNWIAGERLTYADLAAAAQISVIDYLGDAPWDEHEAAKHWYARVKSRPSFRPLLADRLRGQPPAAHYTDLDF